MKSQPSQLSQPYQPSQTSQPSQLSQPYQPSQTSKHSCIPACSGRTMYFLPEMVLLILG